MPGRLLRCWPALLLARPLAASVSDACQPASQPAPARRLEPPAPLLSGQQFSLPAATDPLSFMLRAGLSKTLQTPIMMRIPTYSIITTATFFCHTHMYMHVRVV